MVDIISALGAGSGLNIQELSKNLVTAAKEAPQKQINTKKTEAQTRISSVSTILSTVSSFNSSLSALGNTKLFQRTPVSSDNSKVTVEFKDGSAPPAFSGAIGVNELAKASTLRFGPLSTLDQNISGGTLKIVNDVNVTRNFGALSSLDLQATNKGLTASALGWDPAYAADGATTDAYAGLANFFANGGLIKITTGANGRPTDIELSDGTAKPLTLKISDPENYAPIEDTGVPQQGTLTIGGIQTGANELSFVFGGTLASQTVGLTNVQKTTVVGSLLKNFSTHVNVGIVNNPDFESGAVIKLATKNAVPAGAEVATIDLSQYKSLSALRDKLDSMDELDANIVQGSIDGVSGYYLMVKGQTGAANRLMAATTGFTALSLDTSSGAVTKGRDASITVDGVSMTSASNQFDDIIPGVRFTALAKTNAGETVSVGSTTNNDALTQAMSTLVGGFNTLQQTIAEQIKYDPDRTKRGGLSGSTPARNLLNELRRFSTQPIAGYGTGTFSLAELGVRTNKDGSLTLDETVFSKVLAANPSMVEAVLASKQNVSDSRIKIAGVTAQVPPGRYIIEKKDATTWTINGQTAKVTANRLSGPDGSMLADLKLAIPNAVLAAPVGYSATVNYGIGLVDRVKTMLSKVEGKDSAINAITANAEADVKKLETDQAKLDARMTALQKRYMIQFIAMENATKANKSTQTSLTQFVDSWTAMLKNG
jgi:flagellar hook-associated protein 2